MKLSDCQLGAFVQVDNHLIDFAQGRIRAEWEIMECIKDNLAFKIATDRLIEDRKTHHTEFSLRVYVITPDQLAEMIREEAMAIARYLK